MASIDWSYLKQINLERFINENGFTELKKGTGLCPLHSEKTPSFHVNKENKFKCFGCGKQGDIVDFVSYYYSCDTAEAVSIISGDNFDKVQEKPVKSSIYDNLEIVTLNISNGLPELFDKKTGKTVKILNPKTGEFKSYRPSDYYVYINRNGHFYCYVLRINLSNGKKITPAVYLCNYKGRQLLSLHKGHELPPLFGEYHIKHFEKIILCDGEKTVRAINTVYGFKKVLAVCCIGGWGSLFRQDLTILKGKDVTIIPDQSDDEYHQAEMIINAVKIQKPRSLKIVSRDKSKPKGWDIADALLIDGWSGKQVNEWVKTQIRQL